MRRLSGCAQGSKSSDSKPSRSAFRLLQQQGGAWHCGAVSRSGGGNTRCTVQGSESGHAVCTLDRRVRVEQYSASRGGVACMQGEAGAARAGEAFCARVVRCCAVRCASARLGPSSVSRCVSRFHRRCLKSGLLSAVTKNSHVFVSKS